MPADFKHYYYPIVGSSHVLKRSPKVLFPLLLPPALLPQATAGIVMTDAHIDTPQQKNHRILDLLQPSTADLCVDLGHKFYFQPGTCNTKMMCCHVDPNIFWEETFTVHSNN